MQVIGFIFILTVGHGLCRGNGFAIQVSRTAAVLHIIRPLSLVSPELPLRFVHHLFYAYGIARNAEGIAYGLCGKRQTVVCGTLLEDAEIVVTHTVGYGLAVVIQRMERLLLCLHHIACQHRQPWSEVIAAATAELLHHQRCPVLRASLMGIHRHALHQARLTVFQRVKYHLHIAVPVYPRRLL